MSDATPDEAAVRKTVLRVCARGFLETSGLALLQGTSPGPGMAALPCSGAPCRGVDDRPRCVLVQAIPPKRWTPRKRTKIDLEKIRIDTPIKQHVRETSPLWKLGGGGVGSGRIRGRGPSARTLRCLCRRACTATCLLQGHPEAEHARDVGVDPKETPPLVLAGVWAQRRLPMHSGGAEGERAAASVWVCRIWGRQGWSGRGPRIRQGSVARLRRTPACLGLRRCDWNSHANLPRRAFPVAGHVCRGVQAHGPEPRAPGPRTRCG